jgi:hypothetical protein
LPATCKLLRWIWFHHYQPRKFQIQKVIDKLLL